jgi:C4-dicarboxylate-specific signal transduction histidine kinase
MEAKRSGNAWDMRHTALAVATALLLILTLWLMISRAQQVGALTQELRQHREAESERLMEQRLADTAATAEAYAAGIAPLVALRGQVPEITERTLQQSVAALIADGDYTRVEVTDASNRIIASNDLARIGQQTPPMPPQERMDEDGLHVVRSIMSGDTIVGTLILVRREG